MAIVIGPTPPGTGVIAVQWGATSSNKTSSNNTSSKITSSNHKKGLSGVDYLNYYSDVANTQYIKDAIQSFTGNKTIIIITHERDLFDYADKIIEFKSNGELVTKIMDNSTDANEEVE